MFYDLKVNLGQYLMIKLTPTFFSWNLTNKSVFLRADFNEPIYHETLLGTYRLRATLPTIDYLLDKNATIFLATHLGRPHGYTASLSTKHLIPWFEQHGYQITFIPHEETFTFLTTQKTKLYLLENLRFFQEETASLPSFAEKLSLKRDFYVNEAFGACHRSDTSLYLTAKQFDYNHRSIGFLIQKELHSLSLIKQSKHPFALCVGGGKIHEKIKLIDLLIDSIDLLVLLPGIVFTFMKLQGKNIGKSIIDETAFKDAEKILNRCLQKNISLFFPTDFQVAENKIEGDLSFVDEDKIQENHLGISIGPKTCASLADTLESSKTIFYNGAMGFWERPETITQTKIVFEIIARSNSCNIIAGGDSLALVEQFGLEKQFEYLLSGGGAALAYLNNENLPALDLFLHEKKEK